MFNRLGVMGHGHSTFPGPDRVVGLLLRLLLVIRCAIPRYYTERSSSHDSSSRLVEKNFDALNSTYHKYVQLRKIGYESSSRKCQRASCNVIYSNTRT